MFPRYASEAVKTGLQDSRVVLVVGPRQAGKTTLVRSLSRQGRTYVTFDDPAVYAAVRQDVVQFVRGLDVATLDEVQRVPELLLEIKRSVDADSRPGRFLLTGSANIMTLPTVADSLTGRLELVSLLPLAQSEILSHPSTFLRKLWNGELPRCENHMLLGRELIERVLRGGYPEAVSRAQSARRQKWLTDYSRSLLTRDVRDIAHIDHIALMPKLLRVLAHGSGQLLNFTQVGAALQISNKTAKRYTDIMEQMYLVHQLPAWSTNRLKRLVKAPKLHFLDAGLLAATQKLTTEAVIADRKRFGAVLETFVVAELFKLIGWASEPVEMYHFRDKDGTHEVDVIIENADGQLVGIEVKAAATVTSKDFRGLRYLAEAAKKEFVMGVVLYDGDTTVRFGDRLFAAPLSCLWH